MLLNGWKEIASHLGRGVRTVQRWEQFGLPVRRPKGTDRSAVLALSEELDGWIKCCALHDGNGPATSADRVEVKAGLVKLTNSLERTKDLLTQVRSARTQIAERTQQLRLSVQQTRLRYGHRQPAPSEESAAFAAAAPGTQSRTPAA